jgi:hypothetical protein
LFRFSKEDIMKGLVSVLLMACFAIALFIGTSDNANGQNCNVQQTQQNSTAALLQQAEINRLSAQGAVVQPQSQFFTQSGGTSASASSAVASPSVAQLRAAAAPRFFAQSVPVAASGGTAASASAVAPSNQLVAQDVGTCNVNASGGGGGGGHGLLSRLRLPRTQTTRSVAITRVSSR